MSYTVIITEEIAANVAVTTQNYPITIEYNATNIGAGTTYGNANVQALLSSGTLTSNVITSGAGQFGNATSTGYVSATGNVLGAYIVGNGSTLSNITGANVTGTVANAAYALTANASTFSANATYALNANAATYATNAVQANVANVANSVAGANVSGTVGLAQYVTQAAQANITSVGTLTGLTVNGAVSVTGNITGGNLITTGIVYTPQVEAAGDLDLNVAGRVNVNGNLRVGDNNTDTQISTHGNANLTLKTDNANSANIVVRWGTNANIDLVPHGTGQTNITGAVSASGNVTGSNIIGNGQYLTNLPAANVSGTVANAAYATSAGSATTANIASVAYSVSAANVTGTVANATYATSAGAASTANTVTDAAQANITSVGTLTSLSVSGNVTAGNVISTGNLQSTQQTVVGTANVGTTGNIVISGKNIATDMAWSPDGGNAATAATGRIVIGTGWNGNITYSSQQNRLAVIDSVTRSNTATAVRGVASEQFVTLAANITAANFRQQGLGTTLRIGGGAAANTLAFAPGIGNVFTVSGGQFAVEIGNMSPAFLGNTTVSHAATNGGTLTIAAGSTLTNGFGYNSLVTGPVGATAGNITNYIGYSSSLNPGAAVAGNVYMFYNGNATSTTSTNVFVNNTARQAADYYAFYNADDHAQIRLGSLKYYNEFRYDTATSGTVNISKANGQVQYIRPTGNVTIGDLQNFVTETTDGSTYDQQIDTVTLVVAQGSTPYSITMPTGNAAIKYAGNVSTVPATANAVTMISVSAANIASVKTYMVTISPEFV